MYSRRDRKINGQSGIGQSLINSRKRQKKEKFFEDAKFFHPDDQQIQEKVDKDKMKSIIDQNSLVEYMQLSTLANKNFDATKQAELVKEVGGKKTIIDFTSAKLKVMANSLGVDKDDEILRRLRLPRRPDWREHIGQKEILKQKENLNFVNWRKELSEMEQSRPDLIITPYEKNIEIWRQLWRVCENSHLLLQIVDGRDPMFYRCEDLEVYLQELNQKGQNTGISDRQSWICINKADLLSDEIRQIWADYLNKNGLSFVFFSAFAEQEKILKEEQEQRNNIKTHLEMKEEKEQQMRNQDEDPKEVLNLLRLDDEIDNEQQQQTQIKKASLSSEDQEVIDLLEDQWKPVLNSPRILTKQQLLVLLSNFSNQYQQNSPEMHDQKVQIGTVGYPNVGKSSVINVLCDKKVVSVANMPGKTRHLQTYDVGDSLRVCDCPGLVFPSTKKSSRGGLVLAGVLPVHQMRDYIAPIDLLLKKIPYTILNLFYKMHIIDNDIDGRTFLETFGRYRGYHAGGAHGGYDLNRCSRQVLLDYLSGDLLYIELPECYDNKDKHVNQSNWKFDDTWQNINTIQEQDKLKQAVYQKNKEDNMVDQEAFFTQESQALMIDALAQTLTDDDVMALLDGKKIREIKFDKNLRREVKHCIKRQDDIDIHDILSRDGVIINGRKLDRFSMKSQDMALYKNKGKIHARF